MREDHLDCEKQFLAFQVEEANDTIPFTRESRKREKERDRLDSILYRRVHYARFTFFSDQLREDGNEQRFGSCGRKRWKVVARSAVIEIPYQIFIYPLATCRVTFTHGRPYNATSKRVTCIHCDISMQSYLCRSMDCNRQIANYNSYHWYLPHQGSNVITSPKLH